MADDTGWEISDSTERGGGCRGTGVTDAEVSLGFGMRDRTPPSRQRETSITDACRQFDLGEKLAG